MIPTRAVRSLILAMSVVNVAVCMSILVFAACGLAGPDRYLTAPAGKASPRPVQDTHERHVPTWPGRPPKAHSKAAPGPPEPGSRWAPESGSSLVLETAPGHAA